jgi:hypothetical protein
MRWVLAMSLCALLCGACAMSQPRVQRDLDVPETPAIAFARALKTTMAIQGTIHDHSETLGMISATVGNHVTLNVIIRPQGTGSHIEVAHQGAQDMIYWEKITWVDTWIAAYHRQQ